MNVCLLFLENTTIWQWARQVSFHSVSCFFLAFIWMPHCHLTLVVDFISIAFCLILFVCLWVCECKWKTPYNKRILFFFLASVTHFQLHFKLTAMTVMMMMLESMTYIFRFSISNGEKLKWNERISAKKRRWLEGVWTCDWTEYQKYWKEKNIFPINDWVFKMIMIMGWKNVTLSETFPSCCYFLYFFVVFSLSLLNRYSFTLRRHIFCHFIS